MLNLKNGTAGPRDELIVEWRVYFQCPFGVAETLDAAIQMCERNDMDPNIVICPVAVAITKHSYEIIFSK